jgi:hypothetical protein
VNLSLVDETAVDTGDGHLIMTEKAFDNIDPQFRRRLAAEANTDEINGKSTALEMKYYFCRQRSLTDYVE